MVLQGRLEGQAPDIDSVVYLTDCDPARVRDAATLIRARIVGARGYDLVAAPLQSAHGQSSSDEAAYRRRRPDRLTPDCRLCYIDGWQLRVRQYPSGPVPTLCF